MLFRCALFLNQNAVIATAAIAIATTIITSSVRNDVNKGCVVETVGDGLGAGVVLDASPKTIRTFALQPMYTSPLTTAGEPKSPFNLDAPAGGCWSVKFHNLFPLEVLRA